MRFRLLLRPWRMSASLTLMRLSLATPSVIRRPAATFRVWLRVLSDQLLHECPLLLQRRRLQLLLELTIEPATEGLHLPEELR